MEKNDPKYDIFFLVSFGPKLSQIAYPATFFLGGGGACFLTLPRTLPLLYIWFASTGYFKFLANYMYFKMCGEHCILLSPMKKVNYPFWPGNKALSNYITQTVCFLTTHYGHNKICTASNQKFCSDHRKEVIMAICQATQKIFFFQSA